MLTAMTGLHFPTMHDVIASLGISPTLFWILFAAGVVIVLALKGFALWHAARNYQRIWFVALLVVNTFGFLELVYLLGYRKDKTPTTPSLFNTPEGPVSSPSV
jgi:hypothetical protein